MKFKTSYSRRDLSAADGDTESSRATDFRRHLSRAYYCPVNVDVLQEYAFELNTALMITEFLQNGAISTPQFPYSCLSVQKSNDQQCA